LFSHPPESTLDEHFVFSVFLPFFVSHSAIGVMVWNGGFWRRKWMIRRRRNFALMPLAFVPFETLLRLVGVADIDLPLSTPVDSLSG